MADIERIERELREAVTIEWIGPVTLSLAAIDNIRALLSELSRLREREAKAVEVMRPFADHVNHIGIGHADDAHGLYRLFVGELRAARAFIAEHGDGKPVESGGNS